MEKDINQYAFIFGALGPVLLAKIPMMAKEGHIKTLAKSLIPEPRVEDYQRLRWFVCKSEEPLILGDVGCVFEVKGKKRFVSLNDKEDELSTVYLPISSNTMVLGSNSIRLPQVDFNAINETSAKISRYFFLCRESSSKMHRLLTVLGTEAEILSNNEIGNIVREIILED